VFATITPYFVAPSILILSTPTPALTTIFNFGKFANILSVSFSLAINNIASKSFPLSIISSSEYGLSASV
jgi:hypothetical protein